MISTIFTFHLTDHKGHKDHKIIELLKQDSIILCFKGIDTISKIMFNNVELGTTENMFRQYTFNVMHPDLKKNPVVVSARLDGKPVDSLTFWNPMSTGRQYFIPENAKLNHELYFTINRTWNPKKSGTNQDHRNIGIAVSEIDFLKTCPKEGLGFYSTEMTNGDKVHAHGWPKDKPLEYRWTQQRASLNLQNEFSNGGSIFFKAARPEISKNPVHVELIGESGMIRQFTISDAEWKKITLMPDDLGISKMLTIQVDKTWNPRLSGVSDDGRDLGVAVALLEE